MKDKELLELAAKAAGYVVTGRGGMSRGVFVHYVGAQPDECGDLPNFHWDPLTDDGDALRLARSILMRIDFYKREVWYPVGGGRWQTIGWHLEAYKGAVVRAAAEIGRTK